MLHVLSLLLESILLAKQFINMFVVHRGVTSGVCQLRADNLHAAHHTPRQPGGQRHENKQASSCRRFFRRALAVQMPPDTLVQGCDCFFTIYKTPEREPGAAMMTIMERSITQKLWMMTELDCLVVLKWRWLNIHGFMDTETFVCHWLGVITERDADRREMIWSWFAVFKLTAAASRPDPHVQYRFLPQQPKCTSLKSVTPPRFPRVELLRRGFVLVFFSHSND